MSDTDMNTLSSEIRIQMKNKKILKRKNNGYQIKECQFLTLKMERKALKVQMKDKDSLEGLWLTTLMG